MAEPLDLTKRLPDRAHEAIRTAVLQAIADIEWNAVSSDLSLDLVDTLFQLLTTVQDAITQHEADAEALTQRVSAVNTRAEAAQINAGTAQDGVDALQAAVAALTTRLSALEQTPGPDPLP